ncbi:hypothetical protein D1007_50525 [Hordeum vulgare]|nr:hypothetical protein D1007_50525 [Hordeum vulgare]
MAAVHGSGAGSGIPKSSQTTAATTPVVPTGMDPARAFYLNWRMETTVLGSSGTTGSDTGFNFHLVVDYTSTFVKFRFVISDKYPWGLYDVVKIRNALATYAIKTQSEFKIEKSEPGRLTVHCAYRRYAVKNWVRENSNIALTQLEIDLKKKYGLQLPYMRVFYGKQMGIYNIYGKWTYNFQLLYTFKAEVEKATPGSVVHIDRHTIQFEKNGQSRSKECFRRVLVSFKACWKGFLDGCRPCLGVDATALNGRFKGQLVSACAVDANHWIFLVPYGVLEVENLESWIWFFEHLKNLIGHPDGLVIHTDACKGLEAAVDDVFP